MSKTVIVFPGQGSQQLGMLKDYYEKFKTFRDIINQAREQLGYDLWSIIQVDQNKLNQTEFTQPALLATSYGVFKVLKQQRPEINIGYFAGHSLGEYTALLAAECISYKDALELVSTRAKLMQDAVKNKDCAMSAVLGLSDQDVIKCCQEASDVGLVEAANFNSVGQVVISGERIAVEKACDIAKQKGAKRTQNLPVSVASHCYLMKNAADKFKLELDQVKFKQPTNPIVQNFDAKLHSNPQEIKLAIIKQLYKPVLWTQSIQGLIRLGVNNLIECGPNKVLCGLTKRIDKSLSIKDTSTINSLENI